jgi:hypothetical protein
LFQQKNAILKTKKVALKQPKVSLIPLLFLELQFFSEKSLAQFPISKKWPDWTGCASSRNGTAAKFFKTKLP